MTTLRRINQDDLRNHKLSVVISTPLRAAEPMSRAELAKQTGLTKATMSLLVSMLVDNGVVREGTPSVQSSYGRPSTPLLIVGGRYCGIGLQVNTDGYGTIVLDLDGTVVAERWVDADMSDVDADDIFSELNALSLEQERLLADRGYTVTGTGLALPGLVTDDMRLLMARNLGWEQLDLKRFDVVRRLDATAGNEANMAALAQIPGYAMHREDDGIVGTQRLIHLPVHGRRHRRRGGPWRTCGDRRPWIRRGTRPRVGGAAGTGVPVWAAGVPGDLCRPQGDGGVRRHRQRVGGRAARVDQRADRTVA